MLRIAQRGVDVAEFQGGGAMRIAVLALVDWLARSGQALLDGQVRGQLRVRDIDQIERAVGGLFIDRGHSRHRVANVTDLIRAQCLLVLADR